MTQKIKIGNLDCLCSSVINKKRIAYILYPLDILSEWIEPAAEKYGVTIAAITGMDWQNGDVSTKSFFMLSGSSSKRCISVR